MERKKTMTMNWKGVDDDNDDEHFFESLDGASSSDEDEEFQESRMSFSSNSQRFRIMTRKASTVPMAVAIPDFDYNIWMAAPGSITERRRRLLYGMGLDENKESLRLASIAIGRAMTRKFENNASPRPDSSGKPEEATVPDSRDAPVVIAPKADAADTTAAAAESSDEKKTEHKTVFLPPSDEHKTEQSPVPFVLVRSRSDGDVDCDTYSLPKMRKEELIGKVSKQRLTRTSSEITLARPRMCPYTYWSPAPAAAKDDASSGASGDQQSKRQHGRKLTAIVSNTRFASFFLIKNLDTGKEFIVTGKDPGGDGNWSSLNDIQTGKKLTMEEFEKSVGHSPIVKELMRRGRDKNDESKPGANYYLNKSLRMSKKTGAALLKNLKGVATPPNLPPLPPSAAQPANTDPNQKQTKNNEWIRVRQSGKTHKELSALHMCQEFQAHEGGIWTIKFSWDGHYLASGGEDKVIHVWEVQECELMSLTPGEGNLTPLHPALLASSATNEGAAEEKKGKSGNKKDDKVPEHVHVPETVFSLSDKPFCTFQGHSEDVLDLSWSKCQLLLSSSMDKTVRLWDLELKTCLKVFTHNDYVTCVQFNPIEEDYFISGSLDAKIRIWSIPRRQVVDWADVHEMVTAVSYTPDGQAALVGTHNGTCCMYGTEDCKLSQTSTIDLQQRKKAPLRKITGFQFAPSNPSEVLVTSADSRIKIVEGTKVVHKFQGFRNSNSQIAASFSPNGRHVISASEDSQVYVWKYDEPRQGGNNAKARALVMTRAFESFPCKDVSVAVPWPFTIKGDPPQAKKTGKTGNLPPLPNKKESDPSTTDSPPTLPPLPPKKNATDAETTSKTTDNNEENTSSAADSGSNDQQEVDPAAISRTESLASDSTTSSTRHDDPSAISATNASSSSRSSSSRSLADNNQAAASSGYPVAWGLVIATASIGGEIRCYQNFGLPKRISSGFF
ncbi:WD repeat-containing protein YMR102C-like [Neltuma alba]|uniref:WD repeat-containing protein YMR102C-like n=1 Tax=Neltuma alba TaxID=207710 RepID=UPI0010A2E36A|nr:WD repeat-containing protein YMR102C-like [Prosopis alba]